MALLSERDKEEIKHIFEHHMEKPVELLVILDYENNREPSEIAKQLMDELMELSDKLKVEYIDVKENPDILDKYGVNFDTYGNRKGPVFLFKEKPNIVFFGLPAGEEFAPFLEDLMILSTGNLNMNLKAATTIKKIEKPLEILIFVTPTCPYCPIMTSAAHKFAYINENIKGVMVEATEFPELSDAYQVMAVPRNVIRSEGKDLLIWEGAIPEHLFAEKVKEALEHL